ncbi:MAG TPA: hypothetical protein VFB99_02170 [Vicinamibacterales bacterium]|nr:hypothetical protein [Vicinamibacterales bacterium]
MATYVKKSNGFAQGEPLSRECPHCGAHAQLVPIATPSFDVLVQTRPKRVGLVFRCAACNEPRFLRATIREFGTDRVELSPNLVEVERVHERFQYGYLPEHVERLLRETFECYTAGLHNAFASMCRRTARMALSGLDPQARRRWQEGMAEVLRIGEIDGEMARMVEAVLFGDHVDPPEISPDESAVLIEVVKDLFYQSYVRTAKLRAAMKMRRFFADQGNVTPIDRGRRELA